MDKLGLIMLLISAMDLSNDEVEQIKAGRDLEKAYSDGAFCLHCPAFDECNLPPNQKARQNMGQGDPRDSMTLWAVKMLTGLDKPDALKIAGEKSVTEAYMTGQFCSHCPAFTQNCQNPPAIKARMRKVYGKLDE